MNRLINFAKLWFSKFTGLFPSQLPVGVSEFDSWAERIVKTYELEALADAQSLKFVLANVILHLDQSIAHASDWYMAKRLLKAASNQVSSYKFQEIKQYQEEARAKEQAAAKLQQTEATVSQPEASNVIPVSH